MLETCSTGDRKGRDRIEEPAGRTCIEKVSRSPPKRLLAAAVSFLGWLWVHTSLACQLLQDSKHEGCFVFDARLPPHGTQEGAQVCPREVLEEQGRPRVHRVGPAGGSPRRRGGGVEGPGPQSRQGHGGGPLPVRRRSDVDRVPGHRPRALCGPRGRPASHVRHGAGLGRCHRLGYVQGYLSRTVACSSGLTLRLSISG
jgi:hypothetical protein